MSRAKSVALSVSAAVCFLNPLRAVLFVHALSPEIPPGKPGSLSAGYYTDEMRDVI